jgi:hypothetical protein
MSEIKITECRCYGKKHQESYRVVYESRRPRKRRGAASTGKTEEKEIQIMVKQKSTPSGVLFPCQNSV